MINLVDQSFKNALLSSLQGVQLGLHGVNQLFAGNGGVIQSGVQSIADDLQLQGVVGGLHALDGVGNDVVLEQLHAALIVEGQGLDDGLLGSPLEEVLSSNALEVGFVQQPLQEICATVGVLALRIDAVLPAAHDGVRSVALFGNGIRNDGPLEVDLIGLLVVVMQTSSLMK